MSIDEKLYINNELIHLPVRSVGLTLQINDIGDIKDRNAHYSNNIKIPPTPENVLTFELLGLTGSTTRIPYLEVSVKYVVNGIELISNGKGIVKNTNVFYNLLVYDGNISLVDLLGKKHLSTLDFSSHNHTLSESIFTSSFSKTSGYIYALARFYDRASTSIFSIDVTSPSFYMHTLFDMIFTQEGYSITGDIFTDADFKERAVSTNNGFERVYDESENLVYTRNNSNDDEVIQVFNFPFEERKEFVIDSYTVATTGNHIINVNGNISITFGSQTKIGILIDDVHISELDFANPFDIDFNVFANAGQKIGISIYIISQEIGGNQTKVQFQTSYITTIKHNPITIEIDFANLFGTFTRIDFVRDIMQRFGLVFRKLKNENTFEFKKIKDILDDKANAENWSDKYSDFVNEKYKPNYAQTNILKYRYDSTDSNVTPTFADGEIILDNNNLSITKTLLTSLFKASKLIDSSFYGLTHWVDDEEQIIVNDDGLRIFKVIKNVDTISYNFKFGTISGVNFTGTVPVLTFKTYQQEVNSNYKEFKSMLNDYSEINLNLNISVVDVYELDFFKLKYFKKLGAYYYLNKVVNFKNNKTTKVQLIKIGDAVTDALAMVGTYTGDSTYAGVLTKAGASEMIGSYTGSSTYAGDLKGISSTAVTMNTTGVILESVCSQTRDTERYHDGASSLPAVNDFVYTDVATTILFDGDDLYYRVSGTVNIKINTLGKVTVVGLCIF